MPTRLVDVEWVHVPAEVARRPHAVGFFNRRRDTAPGLSRAGYWADLCIYRGYALLADPIAGLLERRPPTILESERFLSSFLDVWASAGVTPAIITIGEDTTWRFGDMLTPTIGGRTLTSRWCPTPSKPLKRFGRNRTRSCRWFAAAPGCRRGRLHPGNRCPAPTGTSLVEMTDLQRWAVAGPRRGPPEDHAAVVPWRRQVEDRSCVPTARDCRHSSGSQAARRRQRQVFRRRPVRSDARLR